MTSKYRLDTSWICPRLVPSSSVCLLRYAGCASFIYFYLFFFFFSHTEALNMNNKRMPFCITLLRVCSINDFSIATALRAFRNLEGLPKIFLDDFLARASII